MAETNSLANRIEAEFAAVAEKIKKFRVEQVQEHTQRQQRLDQLNKVFDQLREIWKPRLEVLINKCSDRVQATPRIVPSTREVTFEFQSRLARVNLKFSAFTDRDIQKVFLSYDLSIIPMLMKFKTHDEIEFPLNAVDLEVATQWFDDRIVDFVQTYLSMGENEIYLRDEMVEDPIAHVRFPNFVAATMLEWNGQKYYFVGEETRREFERQKGIASK